MVNMRTLNDEGKERVIDRLAFDTWAYMKNETRKWNDRKESGIRCFSKDELCENNGFTEGQWRAVRDGMYQRGYPLEYIHPVGYRVGEPGSQASIEYHGLKVAEGIARNMRDRVVEMAQNPRVDPQDIINYLRDRDCTIDRLTSLLSAFDDIEALPAPVVKALLPAGKKRGKAA